MLAQLHLLEGPKFRTLHQLSYHSLGFLFYLSSRVARSLLTIAGLTAGFMIVQFLENR